MRKFQHERHRPMPKSGPFTGLPKLTQGALHMARIVTVDDLQHACCDGRINLKAGQSYLNGLGKSGVQAIAELLELVR